MASVTATGWARESWPVPGAEDQARLKSYDQYEKDLQAKLKPEIEAWGKKGKPFIPWASKPEDLPQAKIPAFPGAEGGGEFSFGGRGGKVYVVTTLADSGPGSLREACESAGPRIVVFGVAGIIHLKMPIFIEAPYITIAGQTAPGDGVCIADQGLVDNAHDVVIRYLRLRRGVQDIYYRHGVHYGNPVGNIVLDHLSASWGNDQNLDTYRHMYQPPEGGPAQKLPSVNVTIQWCITSEGLNTWNHAFGGDWGGRNTGFTHNLFACNTGRNPSIAMSYDFNFVNNVLFNWRHRTVDGGDAHSTINMINNYFKPGPATPEGDIRHRIVKPELRVPKKGAPQGYPKVYAAGNIVDGDEAVTKDNWDGGVQFELPGQRSSPEDAKAANNKDPRLQEILAKVKSEAPLPMPRMRIESAKEAYEAVLEHAGATLPRRDAVDQRVIKEVRTGKTWGMGQEIPVKAPESLPKNDIGEAGNGIITDISQVGGYPEYKGDPVTYTQHDGIPDWWKKKYGLDVNDPDLATKDCNGDGYTNIEKYLDGLDPTKKIDWTDPKNNVDHLTSDKLLVAGEK
ncbi:MAG: pectate lyase family protein [Phycisphaerae bacterium]